MHTDGYSTRVVNQGCAKISHTTAREHVKREVREIFSTPELPMNKCLFPPVASVLDLLWVWTTARRAPRDSTIDRFSFYRNLLSTVPPQSRLRMR